MKIASIIQYTVYGVPSVFYGDEAAHEGYHDPFCRMPFPWNDMHACHRAEMLEYYKVLGGMRNDEAALDGGDFYVLDHNEHAIAFVREKGSSRLIVAATRDREYKFDVSERTVYEDILTGQRFVGNICIEADRVVVLREIRGAL